MVGEYADLISEYVKPRLEKSEFIMNFIISIKFSVRLL